MFDFATFSFINRSKNAIYFVLYCLPLVCLKVVIFLNSCGILLGIQENTDLI